MMRSYRPMSSRGNPLFEFSLSPMSYFMIKRLQCTISIAHWAAHFTANIMHKTNKQTNSTTHVGAQPRPVDVLRQFLAVQTVSETALYLSLSLSTRTFYFLTFRVILEHCDLWDIWSEWWGDMTWPTKRRWKRQRQRQWQRQIQRQKQTQTQNS